MYQYFAKDDYKFPFTPNKHTENHKENILWREVNLHAIISFLPLSLSLHHQENVAWFHISSDSPEENW